MSVRISMAVYAGSFDMPTKGHEWVMTEAARLFPPGRLSVAVADNPDKKYMFTFNERIGMMQSLAPGDVSVVPLADHHLLAIWARACGFTHLIRGIRNSNDFVYEMAMGNVNRDLAPEVNTVYLMPPRDLCEISSSMVKGLIGVNQWESIICPRYISESVLDVVSRKVAKRTDGDDFPPDTKGVIP